MGLKAHVRQVRWSIPCNSREAGFRVPKSALATQIDPVSNPVPLNKTMKKIPRVREMAQWVKTLATKSNDHSLFLRCAQWTELSPAGCLLTSIPYHSIYMCTHTHKQTNEVNK